MQDQTADPHVRWSRAVITALVALALAVVAHVSAGGQLPSPPWTVALLVVLTGSCAAFLGRAASTLRVVALVSGAQMFAHLVMTAISGHGGQSAASAASAAVQRPAADVTGRRTGSYFDLTMNDPSVTERADASAIAHVVTPHWFTHVLDDLSGANAMMAVAHLLAAAALGGWLAWGERGFWALVALTGHRSSYAGAQLLAALREAADAVRATARRVGQDDPQTPRPDVGRRVTGGTADPDPGPRLLVQVASVVTRRGPPVPSRC